LIKNKNNLLYYILFQLNFDTNYRTKINVEGLKNSQVEEFKI